MRCYITLLACGWLLLMPPPKQQSTWMQVKAWLGYTSPDAGDDTKARYSRWVLAATYASSDDCYAGINWRNDGAKSRYDSASKNWIQQNNKATQALYDAVRLDYIRVASSVCIPSDAVKLQ